jgi:hypothetical protein
MTDKLVRLEIITSEAVVDDLVKEADFAVPGFKYTQVPDAHGRGCTVPKMNDAIWPERNSVFTIYCTEDEASRLLVIVKALRERYSMEGVACFKSYAEEL